MSRIYEAIQRADLERNTAHKSEGIHLPVLVDTPLVEELPEPTFDVDLEKIQQHRWNPSLTSLPTLAHRGAGVEQFRTLRSHIDQLRLHGPIKTILISSGMPGEGKTFVAANLALSFARNSVNRVLLIDGDLRRGTLHNLLGAPSSPGLTEYLAGTAELTSVMQRSDAIEAVSDSVVRDISNVAFIPAGVCNENSSEVVSTRRMHDLISILSPHFNWIIIDSPPVLAVTDAVELARAADAVLLVARGATTPFDVAQRTQAAFTNSRILGFVLNAVKEALHNASYSNYYGREEGGGKNAQ